jgi:hypothetical protein
MNRNQYIKRMAIALLFAILWALRRVLRPRRVALILEIVAVIVLTLTALEVWQRTH